MSRYVQHSKVKYLCSNKLIIDALRYVHTSISHDLFNNSVQVLTTGLVDGTMLLMGPGFGLLQTEYLHTLNGDQENQMTTDTKTALICLSVINGNGTTQIVVLLSITFAKKRELVISIYKLDMKLHFCLQLVYDHSLHYSMFIYLYIF